VRKYLAEMFGTFCLVFAGTGAVIVNDVSGGAVTHAGVAITFGLVVMAMIYSVGDVSGAHFIPAVTFGFWAARRLPGRLVLPYAGSQVLGGVLASALLRALFPQHASLGATVPAGPAGQSFVFELVLTAMLMFVILNVSTGPKETGVLAGIAVGGVIALEAMFAGPICGASMNPARSLAPALVSGQTTALACVWIYLAAPVLGAAVAVPCWRLTRERPAPEVAPEDARTDPA
jgi:aquaporin Z